MLNGFKNSNKKSISEFKKWKRSKIVSFKHLELDYKEFSMKKLNKEIENSRCIFFGIKFT